MPPTPKKKDVGNGGDSGTQYRFVGSHATILESGQPLAPGDYITLTEEDLAGHNQTLLDDGHLIDASDIPAPGPMETQGKVPIQEEEAPSQEEASPAPTTEEGSEK